MAIRRYLKKPSIPSLNGTPEAALPVLKPMKETLEILTGRKGEKIAQLAGTVTVGTLAERVNEIIRVLQDGSDTEVAVGLPTAGVSVPPAPAAPTVDLADLSADLLAALGGAVWYHDLIMNGDFAVSQRPGAHGKIMNVSGTLGVTYSGMDRWYVRARHPHTYSSSRSEFLDQATSGRPPTSADGQFNQFAFGLGRTTSAGSITAAHSLAIGQTIDAYHYAPYRDKAIEVSFWVKSHLAGTYTLMAHGTATDAANTNVRECCVPYTINAANTWEFKTVTIPVPPNGLSAWWRTIDSSLDGISLLWVLKSAATVTPNQWATAGFESTKDAYGATGQVDWTGTGTPTFYLACVHTSPVRRSGAEEMALCRQFYQRSASASVVRAVAANLQRPVENQEGAAVFGGSNSGAVGFVHPYIQFNPPMRAPSTLAGISFPKFTTYASTGVAGTCRRLTDNAVMNTGQTGLAATGTTGHSFAVDLTGFVDQRIQFSWVADADFFA